MQNFKFEMRKDCRRSRLAWVLVAGIFGLFLFSGSTWAQTKNSPNTGSSRSGSPPPMARPDENNGKSQSVPGNGSEKDTKNQTPQHQKKGAGGCRFRSNDLGLIA